MSKVFVHSYGKCFAYGKTCKKCGNKNHFASTCYNNTTRQRNVHLIDDDKSNIDTNDFLYVGTIENNVKEVSELSWFTTLEINNQDINFKLDTGAMVNIVPVSVLKVINFDFHKIRKTNMKLCTYTQEPIPILGQCHLKCRHKNKQMDLLFYIANINNTPLLGLRACIDLGLLSKVETIQNSNNQGNNVDEKTVQVTKGSNEIKTLLEKHDHVFRGIGCLDKPYRIELKGKVEPVVHPVRKIPFSIRDNLKQSLERLVKEKIIEKSDESAEWVNAIVIIRKPNGSLRICLDPSDLNKFIKRHYLQIPTLEELTAKLVGTQYFSTLDATQGFLQIQLDEESTKLCTFGTPFGRYKFLRLPYGLTSAPEVFQERMNEIFGSIEGVNVYIDDIIVSGKTVGEHNARLEQVLKLASKFNLGFNFGKCKFLAEEVQYMGHKISKHGLEADNSKIEAIIKMPKPVNKEEIQRFLGLVTYVGKFIKNLSDKTAPLRSLLKKDVIFTWEKVHDKSFKDLKADMGKSPCLQFFDIKKPTTISVDASKSGMGAVLLQNGLPCAHSSRALTDAQIRYAQIEKELLAIWFGVEKFKQYVFGQHFTVETDHKPLLQIVNKPINLCPPRLQKILMQLRKYDFTLTYKRGKDLVIADTLSRAFINDKFFDEAIDIEMEAQVCLTAMYLNVTNEKKLL
uniref:Reverse transcriptase domain-containing protein n=1 Tax=Photinus pyralis TaxID=7054 RepID=A0A1Y1LD52_PHOPY